MRVCQFRHFGTSENHAARAQPFSGNSKATQVEGDVLVYSTGCYGRVKPRLPMDLDARLLERVQNSRDIPTFRSRGCGRSAQM